jgi:hypothetical protein
VYRTGGGQKGLVRTSHEEEFRERVDAKINGGIVSGARR